MGKSTIAKGYMPVGRALSRTGMVAPASPFSGNQAPELTDVIPPGPTSVTFGGQSAPQTRGGGPPRITSVSLRPPGPPARRRRPHGPRGPLGDYTRGRLSRGQRGARLYPLAPTAIAIAPESRAGPVDAGPCGPLGAPALPYGASCRPVRASPPTPGADHPRCRPRSAAGRRKWPRRPGRKQCP